MQNSDTSTPRKIRRNRTKGKDDAHGENQKNKGKVEPGSAALEAGTVPPVGTSATMKPRHWTLLLTFLLFVVAPALIAGSYLWTTARDQYASTTGFTVRQEGSTSGSEVLGGLAQITGASVGSDADVLYKFITSQDLVARVDEQLDLRSHYSAPWRDDPVFSLRPNAMVEDLLNYWSRIVGLSFDKSSGLIEVQVRAFSPEMARAVAQAIVDESEQLVNSLNERSRQDLMRYSQADLDVARDRLKDAREEMTMFRLRNRVVDVESDLQARMGVLSSLQQQLASALVDYDVLLTQSQSDNDPRVSQALAQINVIRSRIEKERDNYSSGGLSDAGYNYPTMMTEYERLLADREYAEESYRLALAAADSARASADRKTRYLATYLRPTLPEKSQYPQRGMLLGLIVLFLIVGWTVLSLTYYSLRDRR